MFTNSIVFCIFLFLLYFLLFHDKKDDRKRERQREGERGDTAVCQFSRSTRVHLSYLAFTMDSCECVCVCVFVCLLNAMYKYNMKLVGLLCTYSLSLSTKRICPIITIINYQSAICTMYNVPNRTLSLLLRCTNNVSIRMDDCYA